MDEAEIQEAMVGNPPQQLVLDPALLFDQQVQHLKVAQDSQEHYRLRNDLVAHVYNAHLEKNMCEV
jgi:hypothetical protein